MSTPCIKANLLFSRNHRSFPSEEQGKLLLSSKRLFLAVAGGLRVPRFVHVLRDLVSDIPQLAIEHMLLPLLKDFHRGAHGADHPTSDDALCQLEVVIAEELDTFIEIQ